MVTPKAARPQATAFEFATTSGVRSLCSLVFVFVGVGGMVMAISLVLNNKQIGGTFPFASPHWDDTYAGHDLKVFSVYSDDPIARKQRQDISLSNKLEHFSLTFEHQTEFIRVSSCGKDALKRFEEFASSDRMHLATEIFKYCALFEYGGLFLDNQSPLLDSLDHLLDQERTNTAVLSDPSYPKSMHGSLLMIRQPRSNVAKGMLQVLTETATEVLDSSPLLIPRSLYDLIAKETNQSLLLAGSVNDRWYLLQHKCILDPLHRESRGLEVSSFAVNSFRLSQHCPEANAFCCAVTDSYNHAPTLMTKHPILPYQVIPSPNNLPKPYNAEAGHYEEDDLPFISTVREKIHQHPQEPLLTPNFFETLLQNDCLPADKKCSDCLRDKKGSNCQKCMNVCPCYCKTLCRVPVEEKFISKHLTVTPPLYSRDPSRLVPRIVHQTWFEEITKESYPNMSRLIESFKQSGWEYRFYTDDDARNFLSTHFPPEVRAAYDSLIPGAFRADLFRYCVLLIHGGVYADMDIMLETNLDLAVAPDVGFMVPQDEPGAPVDHRMCLWNGLIAAAPGHPFLVKTIETVVNNVRNRFTSVDYDHLFCPNPELSVLHAFDTLFTAGPCILGATVNKVLGRHGQTSFVAGELDPWDSKKREGTMKGTDFVKGADDQPQKRIPGKTVILHQNKWDMGAHRFTYLERNLVVAATDLPESDDRANQEKPKEHYSKTHVKAGIYGLDKLYNEGKRANEELRWYIDARYEPRKFVSVL